MPQYPPTQQTQEEKTRRQANTVRQEMGTHLGDALSHTSTHTPLQRSPTPSIHTASPHTLPSYQTSTRDSQGFDIHTLQPAHVQHLQRTLGNRRVAQMLGKAKPVDSQTQPNQPRQASNVHPLQRSISTAKTSQPIIQRFSIKQDPIKWHQAQDAAVSGSGQTGVMFISSKSNMRGNTVVVKATDDPPAEALFAEQLHKSIAKVKTPKSRIVSGIEKASLGFALNRIISAKNQNGEDVSRLQDYFQNNFVNGNYIYVMEKAGGDMAHNYAKDDNRADAFIKNLTKSSVMRQLGRLHTIDIYLGNTDRLLSGNWKNIMMKGTTITAIDNVDPNSAYRDLTGSGPRGNWQGD